nr:hypothetical protein BaRGS_019981 [Batillaria attramentaria]
MVPNGDAPTEFKVKEDTGEVCIKEPLDYERNTSYQFLVQAVDRDGLSASAVVQVTVTDVNDNSPYFEPPNYVLNLEASVSKGPLVAVQGMISLIKEFPSGMAHTFRLRVQGTDGGGRVSEQPADVQITVYSGTVHPPVFTLTMYNFSVVEDVGIRYSIDYATRNWFRNQRHDRVRSTRLRNWTGRRQQFVLLNEAGRPFQQASSASRSARRRSCGDPVYIAHAVDIDAGNNGTIRYRIGNDPDHLFRVDSVSGQVYVQTTPGLRASPPVPAADRRRRTKTPEYLSVFGIFTVEGVLNTRDNLDRESQDLYLLKVVATDHGAPTPRSSTASLKIHIRDVNDNDPEFSRAEYKFNILENQPVGTRIGQVTASDRDAGDNQRLQYEFAIPQNKFVINTFSGEVTTLGPLDREDQEAKEDYTLQVYVTDSGTPERSDRATIKIKVLDENDNAPRFTIPNNYTVEVSENRPKGVQVMKVVAQDPDEGDNGTVSYYLDRTGSDRDALDNFSIHPTSGWITTEEVLDYETKTSYRLSVVAHDNGSPRRSQVQAIIVNVNDDNDEAPLFHAKNVNFDVVENVSIGTLVGKVQAEDKDSGENGRVSYYVVGGNVFSLFNVDQMTGEIRTVREIDFEESSSHLLSIQAVDNNAAFPRSSNISVTIRVIDVNDNTPVFENDPVFLRTVRENTPLNHVVHTFVATDRDSGANGTVRYSIVSEDASGPQPTTGNYFKIGAQDGRLRVAKAIDYEQVHSVSVIVQASDSCPVPSQVLSARVTTVVFVLDVNDNKPEFESGFDRQIYIFEDEPIGYPVTVIVAVDSDSNQDDSGNNVVNYGIVSGNDDGKFRLDSDTGSLTIAEGLDRETRASYVLNISAEDAGIPKMASYQALRVQVEDVNDSPPVFEQTTYSGRVEENSPAVYVKDGGYPTLFAMTTVVVEVLDVNDHAPEFEEERYTLQVPENREQSNIITLVAADLDAGSNADIIYRITEGSGGRFEIDSKTGELSCSALNREVSGVYTLTVMATDSGNPQQSGSTKVIVTVLDENDNSPQFNESLYTATIPEDVAKGQTVMRLLASDPDQGQNGEVAYSLGNDTEGFFTVNSTSGDIITSGTFDREKNASFVFHLLASDGGGSGPRNTSVRIEITISDVNDNAPVFRSVPYRTSVSQSTGRQQMVLQVTADDPDAGANGTVEYELLNTGDSGSSLQFFTIDRTSGHITTRQSLSSARGRHSLLVLARDSGSPALSSTGVVEITVGDSSTPALQFQQEEYETKIPENSGSDTFVVRVQATSVLGSPIAYGFANGNEHNTFKVDASSGEIKVANGTYLDYESTPQLQLILSAVAGNDHAYATLRVNLTDQNDNKPKFAQTRYVSAIWENNQPQTYITQVIARDADSGKNGMIDYTIIDGNTDSVFEIDPQHTGIVRTNINVPQLDREIRSSYTLVIEAQDRGYPPKRSNCVLQIAIVDVNDNPPKFPSPGPGPVHISENRQAGFLVAVVTATDVDLNPVLVYSFTSQGNPDGAFSIDRSSGTVLLARQLDHERRSRYTIGLEVTDGKFVETAQLEVRVQDENDNAPRFSRQTYRVTVPEQTPPGTSILTVTATDDDDGDNAVVSYSLGPASDPSFFIDSRNGTIFTNKTITSSLSESVVQLVVVARDGGSPPLSAMVAVQVQVTDVNKYRPEFQRPSYTARVSESAQKGTEIVRVSAVDRDFSHRPDNVHYILNGLAASTFYIQSNTGQILLNGPLDHERTAQYRLTVMAVDRGTPPRNSTVPVTIHVVDENDNPPVFLQSNYSVVLPEDYPLEQIFLNVTATDADDDVSSTLEFSITSGNSDGIFFNHKSGGLVLMSPLDYETRTSHRLIVRAVDCSSASSCEGAARLSAFVTVDVTVTDVNEFDPKFPVAHYYESVPENVNKYLTVFQVHANDQDRGEYGRITYSLPQEGDHSLFRINANSGDVIALRTFDYEEEERRVYNITIQAMDPDGRQDRVGVTISIVDEDEYAPRFNQESYAFEVPGSAKTGMYVGTVRASDADGGAAGRLVYVFNLPTDYFQIDPVTGNITVARTLHEDVDSGEESVQRRKKRALRTDSETLIVKVSSGMENSLSAQAFCTISIDRTCPGCEPPAALPISDDRGLSDVAIAMIVIVCILVPAVVVVLLLVFYCRRKNRKHPPPALQERYGGRVNTLGLTPPPLEDTPGPPAYKDVLHTGVYGRHNHGHNHANITSSDISEQSNNSASSGRGSAEVEDEDDEIRMINANNYLTNSSGIRHKTMPDSGIQQDDDTLSEPSATNHQEYLARLGIDSTKIGKAGKQGSSSVKSGSGSGSGVGGGGGTAAGDIAFSVESMHQFSDEGGGEGGVDFDRLTDTEADEELAMIENSRRHMALNGGPPPMVFGQPEPQQAGALSNVVNSEEEYSGSYNWDYLLDWGPQYQPLAHVFAEIAKLKDESVTPKKTPVKTVPQRRISGGAGLVAPQTRIVPPPIITNAPPILAVEPDMGHGGPSKNGRGRAGGSSSGKGVDASQVSAMSSSSSSGSRSQRTSAMNSSLPSLPRSPISYESSYTSPALTPSFTPSLSPLGAHTPSISPAISGHTSGHASSSHSGHNTPGKPVSNHQHHQNYHNGHYPHVRNVHPHNNNNNNSSAPAPRMTINISASSDSEREFRI